MFKKLVILLTLVHFLQIPIVAAPPRCDINKSSIALPSKPNNFNLFVENSFSLHGYISGNTGFKNDLSRVMIHAKGILDEGNIKFYAVNNDAFPAKITIGNIDDTISPKSPQFMQGTNFTTDINKLLEIVIKKSAPSDVSVLVSDYLYTVKNKSQKEKELEKKGLEIQDTLGKLLKTGDYTTVIVKLKSDFKGTYVDYTLTRHAVSMDRPYYMWFIGKKEFMSSFLDAYKIRELKGFEAAYVLEKKNAVNPNYTMLLNTNKVGSFSISNAKLEKGYRHGLDVSDLSNKNGQKELRFSVAVDLSSTGMEDDYLLDNTNYILPEGYTLQIDNICSPNLKLHQNDKPHLKGKTVTHVLTLTTNSFKFVEDIEIGLKRNIPAWVQDSSTMDDTKTKTDETLKNRTLGFHYLVKGVHDAYGGSNTPFFKIPIYLKK